MSGIWVPLFGIVFTFGSIVAIVAISLRYRARKLEHEEVMKALEQGRELPTLEVRQGRPNYFNDLRNGIIALAAGMGIYAFLQMGDHSMREMSGLGLVPAFIGLGLIAIAMVVKSVEEKEKESASKER